MPILRFTTCASQYTFVIVTNGWVNLQIQQYRLTSNMRHLFKQNNIHLLLIEKCFRHHFNVCVYGSTNNSQLSLAMLDLDDFKKINDTFGHPAGDLVLKDLAIILKQNVRNTDTVVRWGGEEFAIILPNTTLDRDSNLLERIKDIIQSHQFGSIENPINITVSVGFVSYNDLMNIPKNNRINQIDLFIDLADKALYKAKETKNTVVRWSFDCNIS